MKDLKDQVVVITGATSGIGRATALEFCKAGAKVVLSGRDVEALKHAEEECAETGASTIAVTCDVTNEEQVERLAARAAEAFGQIDIWVNNAGVALFAKFEDSPSSDYRRVIETDFFGYVNGARAALKHFRAQGSGTLINVDAVEGVAAKPFGSAYAAAKHAVRALASSLRMELALDGVTDIHVCSVMPASVDTPLFTHAGNYTGRAVQASPQAIAPAQVAAAIVKLARRPRRELLIGFTAKGSAWQYLLTPKTYEQGMARWFPSRHLTDDETATGAGNLFKPTGPHTSSGGWRSEATERRAKARPWIILGGAVVGIAAATTWLLMPSAGGARYKQLMPRKVGG